MEMLLMGVAGCTGMDVVSILKKKRAPFTGFSVHIRGERSEDHPQRYTHVEIDYIVTGEGVKAGDVERAIDLSTSKYCGAIGSLNAKVTHSYRIVPG
jgi:putative redox protein